jgi:hypothetical protein
MYSSVLRLQFVAPHFLASWGQPIHFAASPMIRNPSSS